MIWRGFLHFFEVISYLNIPRKKSFMRCNALRLARLISACFVTSKVFSLKSLKVAFSSRRLAPDLRFFPFSKRLNLRSCCS